jgi:hypothetical protein
VKDKFQEKTTANDARVDSEAVKGMYLTNFSKCQ